MSAYNRRMPEGRSAAVGRRVGGTPAGSGLPPHGDPPLFLRHFPRHFFRQPILPPSCTPRADVIRPEGKREVAVRIGHQRARTLQIPGAKRAELIHEVGAFAQSQHTKATAGGGVCHHLRHPFGQTGRAGFFAPRPDP